MRNSFLKGGDAYPGTLFRGGAVRIVLGANCEGGALQTGAHGATKQYVFGGENSGVAAGRLGWGKAGV